MQLYNLKYRILLSASLHGVIKEHIGQQTRQSPWFESEELFNRDFNTNLRLGLGTWTGTRIFEWDSNLRLDSDLQLGLGSSTGTHIYGFCCLESIYLMNY